MDIEHLRAKIDSLDKAILPLLSERARLAAEIAKVKQENRAGAFVPSRERQILERIVGLNPGPLSEESVRAIFEQIIAACRALEEPISVGYLGPPGTFSHLAATRKFGPASNLLPLGSIEEVFISAEKKETQFGMVPIENSIAGVERTTLDRFVNSAVKICAEYYLEISHNLLSKSPREKIKKIYSHPQPLGQCQVWLRTNFPQAEQIEASSTTRAAQLAAAEPEAAAIGTGLAADIYDLPIIASNIQDRADNRTRFLIIGKEDAQPSGKDKTSLLFSVAHRAGSLWNALGVLHRNKINMTMIESRPTKQTPWEYLFFVDVQGHHLEEPLASTLNELKTQATFVKVLGSYPEAD